jgi:hypothetical protein
MAPLFSHDEMHRAAPTISACSRLLGGVAICHARLNIRSGSEDITGTENWFVTSVDTAVVGEASTDAASYMWVMAAFVW